MDSAVLLVVMRGELGHRSRQANSRPSWKVSADEEREVLQRLQRHVLHPARAVNWRPRVAFDFLLDGIEHQWSPLWRWIYSAGGLARVLDMDARHVALRTRAVRNETQAASFLNTINWLGGLSLSNRSYISLASTQALLFLRNDVSFKETLPFGRPHCCMPRKSILVHCGTWGQREKRLGDPAGLRLSDTLFFVPREMLPSFVRKALKPSLRACCIHQVHASLGEASVSTWYFGYHDSDPAKDWNPSYIFAGRTHARRALPQNQQFFSRAGHLDYELATRAGNARRARRIVAFLVNASTVAAAHSTSPPPPPPPQHRQLQQHPQHPQHLHDPRAPPVDGEPTMVIEIDFDDVPRPHSPWSLHAEVDVDADAVRFVHVPAHAASKPTPAPYAFRVTWPVRVDASRVAIVWWARIPRGAAGGVDGGSLGEELSLAHKEGLQSSRLIVRAPVASEGHGDGSR